jgi:hypothetical protein
MTYKITHKNSTVSGTPPTAGDIDLGEIAINAADVKLFTKDTNGAIQEFISKFKQSGSGAVARTVESKLQDVVSVKDFGAVGDGVTDDTAAIQAAVDACRTSSRTLFIPRGKYVVSSTLDCGVLPASPNLSCSVVGERRALKWDADSGVVILSKLTGTNPVFRFEGASGAENRFSLENITIRPFDSNYNNLGTGVLIFNATRTDDFKNVTIYKLRYGFHIDQQGSGFSEYSRLSRCLIVDCQQAIRLTSSSSNPSHHRFDLDAVEIEFTATNNNAINENTSPIGIYIGSTVFWYNASIDVAIHSGGNFTNKVAVWTKGTANDLVGTVTLEANNTPLIFKADGGSFKVNGVLKSLGNNHTISDSGTEWTPKILFRSIGAALPNNVQASVRNIYPYFDEYDEGSNWGYHIFRWVSTTGQTGLSFTSNTTGGWRFQKSSSSQSVGSLTDVWFFQASGDGITASTSSNYVNLYAPRFSLGDGSGGGALRLNGVTTVADTSKPHVYHQSGVGLGLFSDYRVRVTTNGSSSAVPVLTHLETGHTEAGSDNTLNWGTASMRWANIYAGTPTIQTSDSRLKQQQRELSTAERAVAVKVKSLIKAFKFNDAVEKKGDSARIHFGVYAQELKEVFESEGLNAYDYGLFCYDQWDDQYDQDGNLRYESGDRFSIRYEELLAFIIAAL